MMGYKSNDITTVWLPFFRATNTLKISNIPPEALDRPFEYVLDQDRCITYTRNGHPIIKKVNEDICDNIKIVSDNLLKTIYIVELNQYIRSLTDKMEQAIKKRNTKPELKKIIRFLFAQQDNSLDELSEKRPWYFLSGDFERGKTR